MSVEIFEVFADAGVHLLSDLDDERLVEETESDAPGEVANCGIAPLGGDDQPVENLPVWSRTGASASVHPPASGRAGR